MQTINLNLIPGSVLPVVNVSQYDEGRQFAIAVYDGAAAYSLASKTVQIQGLKADGHGFMYGQSDTVHGTAVLSVSTNVVTVTTPKQMTAAEGNARVELRIKDSSDNVVHTLNFILCVEPSALPDNAEMSASEYSYVQHLIDVAEGISTNVPYIGANGNWWIWDAVTEQYVDSGVDASITVQIADVTMLAPDATPYVTNTGTATDPIFHLFIPRGKGISSITKTGTSGLVDTYTITFSDGATTTFTVTNGRGVPDGGITGQVLAKASNDDGDCEWINPSGGSGGGVLYGTCATDRDVVAKVASASAFTLDVGVCVAIKFTSNRLATPASGDITLDVNNTGAKYVLDGHGGSRLLTFMDDFFWNGVVQQFVYDGTYWVWVNSDTESYPWEVNAVYGVHNILPKTATTWFTTADGGSITFVDGTHAFNVDCTATDGSGAFTLVGFLDSLVNTADGSLTADRNLLTVSFKAKASADGAAEVGKANRIVQLTTSWQTITGSYVWSGGYYPQMFFRNKSGAACTISIKDFCVSLAADPTTGYKDYAMTNRQLTDKLNDKLETKVISQYIETVGGAAQTEYKVGDIFLADDGNIYEATVKILSGATITVDTNCVVTNFSTLLRTRSVATGISGVTAYKTGNLVTLSCMYNTVISNSGSSGAWIQVGTLPSVLRPAVEMHFVGFDNQSSANSRANMALQIKITTAGVISIYLFAGESAKPHFTVTYTDVNVLTE